jgi:hypothetical protein
MTPGVRRLPFTVRGFKFGVSSSSLLFSDFCMLYSVFVLYSVFA